MFRFWCPLLCSLFTALLQTTAEPVASTTYGFIANNGQIYDQHGRTNTAVRYLLPTNQGFHLLLNTTGYSYDTYRHARITEPETNEKITRSGHRRKAQIAASHFSSNKSAYQIRYHRIDVQFMHVHPGVELIPEAPYADQLHYYTHPTLPQGITSVPHYRKVTYSNLYPNIDLIFEQRDDALRPVEFTFVVRPGGNVGNIRWQYHGADSVAIADGTLRIYLPGAVITESIPACWLQPGGTPVRARYWQDSDGSLSLHVPSSPDNQSLIIDPVPEIQWSTYYGNAPNDEAQGVAVQSDQWVYLAGTTFSGMSIATSGAHQGVYAGNGDAFLAQFNFNGQRMWATYFGGTDLDAFTDVVTDAWGNIYAVGTTLSANLATSGAHQTQPGGDYDGLLVKFNANGALLWSTYYGGSQFDVCFSVSADKQANVYIAGYTASESAIATPGAHQPVYSGWVDAFLVQFNSAGQRLWGTYVGGTLSDYAHSVTCSDQAIFLAGTTQSVQSISTASAHQPSIGGAFDAFLMKFDLGGTLQWGTYYGGNDVDEGYSAAYHHSGFVILAGSTYSQNNIATTTAHQPALGGNEDGFAVRFDNDGNRIWGTYFGGFDFDRIASVIADSLGHIYMTGETSSLYAIATSNAYQTNLGGWWDAFVIKMAPSGSLIWGTYFGGLQNDYGFDIAVATSPVVFVAGTTESAAGIATSTAHQPTWGGDYDAFLACFDAGPAVAVPSVSYDCRWQVFPNPTTAQLVVQHAEGSTIDVYDLHGCWLTALTVLSNSQVMSLALPKGQYVMRNRSDASVRLLTVQ